MKMVIVFIVGVIVGRVMKVVEGKVIEWKRWRWVKREMMERVREGG